jgi:hypothetical protein
MIAFLFLAKKQLGNHCPFGFIEMIFTNIKLATYDGFHLRLGRSSPLSTKAAFLAEAALLDSLPHYKMESTHHYGICHGDCSKAVFSRCSH